MASPISALLFLDVATARKSCISLRKKDGEGNKPFGATGFPFPAGGTPPLSSRRRPGPCRRRERDRKDPSGKEARRPTPPRPAPEGGCFGGCRDGAGEREARSTKGADPENSGGSPPRRWKRRLPTREGGRTE